MPLEIIGTPPDNAFSPEERATRVARIRAEAVRVFGAEAKAVGWLNTSHRLLDDQTPWEAIETDLGLQMVTAILGRIEYGVFS